MMKTKKNKKQIQLEVNDIPGVSGIDRKVSLVEKERPEYVLEGREDEVYHELRLPSRGNEPEYVHLDKSWTFNRAMRWLEPDNATIICYSAGGTLALTGKDRVSDWFTDPVNIITHKASELHFEKKSDRKRDCVVLPGLQFHLGQHPVMEISVKETDAEWQCCVIIKGRSGPPLLSTGWRRGKGEQSLDIASAFRAKGFDINFAEIHIAFGVWCPYGEKTSAALSIKMPAQNAVVGCLPLVRSSESVRENGLTLSAVAVDEKGKLMGSEGISLFADFAGKQIAMNHSGGVWTANVPDIAIGDYVTRIHCGAGSKIKETALPVRVTSGSFFSYDKESHSLSREGKALGPLSGSYQGMVFASGVGTPAEKMVQGQAEWDSWDRVTPPGEHWHYWEAMTAAELDDRFAYLEHCGWDLLHLSQGWGIWEKLDACGHVAPHGAEQLALLLRVAARHGLALLQALSHYPYGKKYTPVLQQYIEAGFQEGDWVNPDSGSRFNELFHGYLRDYSTLFRYETAIFAMSTSGEGDIGAGPLRVNYTMRFMRTHMPKHIFVAEPIHRLIDLPDAHRHRLLVQDSTAGLQADIVWEPELAGSRMYWIGMDLHPEIDLGIEFKFLQLGDYFMGEGSWPCPPLYARFMGYKNDAWAGTERYRRRVRDSLYLGLVHRNPIMLTWDEQLTEDERIVLRQARELIDWSQPFQDAPVGIRVDSPNVGVGSWGTEGRLVLGRYEEYFSALPTAIRYLQREEPAPAGMTEIDARKPYEEPLLSAELLAGTPLSVSPGYRAAYLWSADRRTLLAYVYNCTGHEYFDECYGLSGHWHRTPVPTALSMELRNIPELDEMCVRLYDLDTKEYETITRKGDNMIIGKQNTKHDYLLLVFPKK